MSVGLDIGSSQIRCLRRRDAQLVGRSAKAQFTVLPDAPKFRALLAAGQIPFAVCDEALTIVGDNAAEYSNLFNVRPQSLIPHGRLPTNDPVARQSLAALVDALLGEPDQPGEMCGVTFPGGESFQSLATSSELEFFSRLIRLRGFFPQVLSAGMAAVLAELSRHCFTGLGLSFGAATSELVVAHRGIELLMCSIPKGGDWLDEQLAQEFGDMLRDDAGEPILDLAKSETRRRSAERLLSPANDDTDCFLAGLHRDLIYSLIRKRDVRTGEPSASDRDSTAVAGHHRRWRFTHRGLRRSAVEVLRTGSISAGDPRDSILDATRLHGRSRGPDQRPIGKRNPSATIVTRA